MTLTPERARCRRNGLDGTLDQIARIAIARKATPRIRLNAMRGALRSTGRRSFDYTRLPIIACGWVLRSQIDRMNTSAPTISAFHIAAMLTL